MDMESMVETKLLLVQLVVMGTRPIQALQLEARMTMMVIKMAGNKRGSRDSIQVFQLASPRASQEVDKERKRMEQVEKVAAGPIDTKPKMAMVELVVGDVDTTQRRNRREATQTRLQVGRVDVMEAQMATAVTSMHCLPSTIQCLRGIDDQR